MTKPISRIVRRGVRTGQTMVGQIVVSIATALAVAFITNAWLARTGADPAPAATVASAPAATSVDVAAPQAELQQTPVAAAADQTPAAAPRRAAESAANAAPLPPLQAELVLNRPVAGEAPLPEGAEIFPGVPADSALAATARQADAAAEVTVAEAAPVAPTLEEAPAPARRLLGLPLPYFIPTPGEVAESASAAGSRLVSLVEGEPAETSGQ